MSVKPRVLMVDDVPANLVALEAALDGLDCELTPARSGNEALKHLLKGQFAVLLLDVQMPDMDGYEVAHWARSNEASREVPIIFLTAMHETEADVLRGYGSGAVDYLFKPINPHVLRSKVQIFLELHVSRQRLAEEIAAHRVTTRELEAFSYTVSHDLRAPLRSISSFTQILRDDYGDRIDETGRGYIERVLGAASRMDALINDLLELARVTQSDLLRTDVDVSKLSQEAIARLQAAEPARRVEVVVAPDLRVHADRRLCAVVLENLLGNAWKFTAKNDAARIEVGIHPGGTELFVRDNGAGFDMAHAKKLFAAFARLHSPKDFEGTGIGLATVRRIVERHGGRVRAESRVGEGATFSFTFDAAPRPE
jgi:two-component system, sensor histidine kinase and response regulator